MLRDESDENRTESDSGNREGHLEQQTTVKG